MVKDVFMEFSIYLYLILLLFTLFIFLIILISLFKKKKYANYEPDVSVIIPCYNEESNIVKCLDSVFSLDYSKHKLEVIVVDDGSKDGTHKLLSEYKSKHPSLRIIKGKHKGKPDALNLGAKHAKYNVLFTIDADTLVDKSSLKKLVLPLQNSKVAATNGSYLPSNSKTVLGMFQRVEYHYNNLLRRSFSLLFSTGIWFFGAFACYRKDVLKEVGYFQKDSLTEDMAIELQIYEKGYRTENVSDAIGYTLTPSSLIGLFKQRSRWWTGATQALFKHKKLFSFKSDLSIIFLFINQCWWTIFALLSTPLIFYQVNYWLSSNVDTFYHLFMYLFRWFSLLGPFYVLYKIPVWGVSLYSIFGVTTGIITTIIVVLALVLFKDRITWRSLIAMFFYFPYTIILNLIVILSIFRLIFLKKRHFIA